MWKKMFLNVYLASIKMLEFLLLVVDTCKNDTSIWLVIVSMKGALISTIVLLENIALPFNMDHLLGIPLSQESLSGLPPFTSIDAFVKRQLLTKTLLIQTYP